jgi:hypothetical protein
MVDEATLKKFQLLNSIQHHFIGKHVATNAQYLERVEWVSKEPAGITEDDVEYWIDYIHHKQRISFDEWKKRNRSSRISRIDKGLDN